MKGWRHMTEKKNPFPWKWAIKFWWQKLLLVIRIDTENATPYQWMIASVLLPVVGIIFPVMAIIKEKKDGLTFLVLHMFYSLMVFCFFYDIFS